MKILKNLFVLNVFCNSFLCIGQTVNDIYYDAEVIDTLFFHQLDSIVKQKNTKPLKYLVSICDNFCSSNNITYTPQPNDTIIYIMVSSFKNWLLNDYYRVRFKRNGFYVYKGADKLLIKKTKKIIDTSEKQISIEDLISPYWLIEYDYTRMRVRYYGIIDDLNESDLY